MEQALTPLDAEDRAEQKLLADLVDACCVLQRLLFSGDPAEEEKRLYWDVFSDGAGSMQTQQENNRNRLIGAVLQSRGYVLSDPTLFTQRQTGNLDMDIRRTAQTPWTFCEGVNIKGMGAFSMNGKGVFASHLHRIIRFAQKYAFPFYFLIGYMDTSMEMVPLSSNARVNGSKDKFTLESTKTLELPGKVDPSRLKVMEAVYDCGGFPVKIYVILVQVEDRSKPII